MCKEKPTLTYLKEKKLQLIGYSSIIYFSFIKTFTNDNHFMEFNRHNQCAKKNNSIKICKFQLAKYYENMEKLYS